MQFSPFKIDSSKMEGHCFYIMKRNKRIFSNESFHYFYFVSIFKYLKIVVRNNFCKRNFKIIDNSIILLCDHNIYQINSIPSRRILFLQTCFYSSNPLELKFRFMFQERSTHGLRYSQPSRENRKKKPAEKEEENATKE